MTYILAIDQGTTSTRALAVSPDGRAEVVFSREHRQIYPRSGWVEHDPAELLVNLRAALAAAPPGTQAVGLANQGESCLAWDRLSGDALSNVIVWQDERTIAETEALRADGAEALTLSRAGLPIDPYFSASKLAWLLENLPGAKDLLRAGRLRLGTTDAFFRHHLTGRAETDIATASRTSLLNLQSGEWDEELCSLFGVPIDCLPSITGTHGDLGEIGETGQRLAASIVDQQAALRGHGCAKPGSAKITLGTGAFVLAVSGSEPPRAGRGPLPTVAWSAQGAATTFALEGGVYAAAASVNWARSLGLIGDMSELETFEGPPAIARGIAFVPALSGLACPHWDRQAKGGWLGLSLDTDRTLLVRAVLEGVAFRTAEVINSIDALAPLRGAISIDGGMSRSPAFCQFLADTLGRDIKVSSEPECTALGLAALVLDAQGESLPTPEAARMLTPSPQPIAWAEQFSAAVATIRNYPVPKV